MAPADFDLAQFMAELKDAGGFDLNDPARPIREATLEQLEQARGCERCHSDASLGLPLRGP